MTAVAVEPQVHALYRFYSDVGALLYVGRTADPGKRWRQHRAERPWWHEVATVTIQKYPSSLIMEAERYAIRRERPRYNVMHHPDLSPAIDMTDVGELAMVTDIARMFGVTRQAVDLWTREPGFPQPLDTVVAGRIWRTADVVRWAEEKGKVSQ